MYKIFLGLSALFLIAIAAYILVSSRFTKMVTDPAPGEALSPTASLPSIRIVAFGDSLTAGYNLPIDEAYPAQLERLLRERGYSVEVINAGVSGETSAGGVRRTDFIRSLDPDIVLFGLGGNDALRFLPTTDFERNVDTALTALLTSPRPRSVLLLGMRAPGNADPEYRQAFDAVYPKLSAKFSLPLIPFFLEGVALDPRYTLPDGIHPTSEGYAIMVETLIAPRVIEILETFKESEAAPGR